MNFQWILLGFFIAALVLGISKAITRSMLKNVLRLICVPVAFLITFILQVSGVFRYFINQLMDMLNLAAMLPGVEDAIEFINALVSSLVTPLVFTLVFLAILSLLRVVHVNLIAGVIENKRKREQKRELKYAIKEEKAKVKDAIRNSEERAEEALKNDTTANMTVEDIIYQTYKAPDDDDIEDMVEERVERQRKRLKKQGLYKESADRKAISLVAGSVSAFLVLAIMFMPLFSTMDFLASITDGIRDTDADDTAVYQVVEVIDKHIVTPYEESFVNQLYESMALVDLMNYTSRSGGRMVLESGEVIYVGDLIKDVVSHGVRATAELLSSKSKHEHLSEDINVIIANPLIVSVLADAAMTAIQGVDNPAPESGDMFGSLKYGLLDHYQTADKELICNDIRAISSVVGAIADTGIVAGLIHDNLNIEDILTDKDNFGNIIGAAASFSVFDQVMPPVFTSAIQMLGTSLQIPEDDAAAYDEFMAYLQAGMTSSTATAIEGHDFDAESIEIFVKNCVASGKTPTQYGETEDPEGAINFFAYIAHWVNVQNAFMHASEDLSLGYPMVVVEGKLYLYDISAKTPVLVEITDENREEYADKVSPVAELIEYLVINSKTTLTQDDIKVILEDYTEVATNLENKSLAESMINRETFVSKGVTVKKMVESTDFEDWTLEEKQQDATELTSIIFDLMSMMEMLGSSVTESNMDMGVILDQFVILGRAMDAMERTSCMHDLPPLILNGLVKNEMFSKIMNPIIVNTINDTVQNSDKTYEQVMGGLVTLFKALLG